MSRVTLRGDSWYERYYLYEVYDYLDHDGVALPNNRRSFVGVI